MSLVQTVRKSLEAVKQSPHINAFVSQFDSGHVQKLLDGALAAQVRISEGSTKSPVDGHLIAVKDNICTTDLPTSCASEMLREYVSPYEATIIKRLRTAGALIMGKTNMDEFGMGSHSTFSIHGAVRRPGNKSEMIEEQGAISAGGSSGGSAAAVAADMCYAALGTDTGGSVRLPASYCGVIGFKPSYGMVSRWGVVSYANSLDTVGILSRDTKTARQVFDIVNSHDSNDPTNISLKTRDRVADALLKFRRKGPLRIGIPIEYNLQELTPPVRKAWEKTLVHLASQGHKVFPISLPNTKSALSAYYIIAPAEASSNLGRYDGIRYGHRHKADRSEGGNILFAPTRQSGFGDEVRRRILLGTYTLSSTAMDNYFLKAQAVRRLVQHDFDNAFSLPNLLISDSQHEGDKDKVDAIIAPTALSLPPRLVDVINAERAVDGYVNDVLTVPASLAGIPSISVPVEIEDGTTVGMQVMVQWGNEEELWGVAKAVEEMEL